MITVLNLGALMSKGFLFAWCDGILMVLVAPSFFATLTKDFLGKSLSMNMAEIYSSLKFGLILYRYLYLFSDMSYVNGSSKMVAMQ